jgi:hypothetical protein
MRLCISILVVLILSCLFFNCKDNPATPEHKDTPPVVQSFTATPLSVDIGQNVKFEVSASDNEGLDSLVIMDSDSHRHSYAAGRQKAMSDSAVYAFDISGAKTVTATAYADGKTAQKSTTVNVNPTPQDLPPVFDVSYLNGVESQSGSTSIASVAHDPEGKPISVSVKSCDPSILVSVNGSVIKYSGVNSDVNGSYPATLSVSDGKNTTDGVVNFIFAARDEIKGNVHDGKIGMPVETSQPGMILRGPFNLSKSYVTIDNVSISMDANGNFQSPKLVSGTHILKARLVNTSNDSSYVATFTLPAGDQILDPLVMSNKGTDFDLPTEKRFLYHTNTFLVTDYDNHMIKGIDFKHANEYTLWIARKDTVDKYYGHVMAFTTQEQDVIEQDIKDEIYKYLSASRQPRIHKAALNEPLPATLGFTPNDKIILILKEDGFPGTLGRWMTSPGVIGSALITYAAGVPFNDKATVIQEVLSALAAPNDLQDYAETIWQNRSCLAETQPTPYLTPSDINTLYLPILFGNGTPEESVLKLP